MEEFTKAKSMELPRTVVAGHDAFLRIPEVAEQLHLRSPGLIVADKNTRVIAGDRVQELLAESKIETTIYEIEDSSLETIEKIRGELATCGCDFAVGVGGGTTIDVAKYASFQVKRPFISVPTAASHDGIVSSGASVFKDGIRQSIPTHSPLAVIADTGTIATSPHKLLASGCGDIVSNYTAVKDWALAKRLRNEYYSSYAATLSEMTAAMLVMNSEAIKPGLEESAWIVVKALVSSGVAMSIAGSSRPASGSEHKFSHALDRLAPDKALHGEQCGVGTIMMMYLHGGDWEMIRDALKNMGAPVDARGLGLTKDDVIQALLKAHEIKPERYTILGSKGINYEAAEELATITKVI